MNIPTDIEVLLESFLSLLPSRHVYAHLEYCSTATDFKIPDCPVTTGVVPARTNTLFLTAGRLAKGNVSFNS